ncbi:MAG: hypothetical protein EOO64_03815 [Massilia sp.]|nr:MAG: hypothetical protein EOO64_03815 [Massilia sp.]
MNRSDRADPLNVANHNLLLDHLDAIGFPWRLPSATLKKRYGGWLLNLKRDPVIHISTERPFITGMKKPLATRIYPDFAPHMPVSEFFSSVYYQPDARANFERARSELETILGQGKRSSASNTVSRIWRFGTSVCELTAWPPELQSYTSNNSLHQREPWREFACILTIRTGYLMSASDDERAAIAGFCEIARWQPQSDTLPDLTPWTYPSAPEFVRYAEPSFVHCVGAVGTCPQRTNLIYFNSHLHLVALDHIEAIEVERLRKAKGSASSRLYFSVRRPGRSAISLNMCSAPGEDDLNDFAENLAGSLGKPIRLEPYEYNC